MTCKEMDQLIRRLRGMGVEAHISKGGHWKIKAPSGQTVVCPQTPTHPGRSVKNTIARLRREGVPI